MKTHFKRYEIKYIIPTNISDRLLPQLLNYMQYDPYMKGDYYEVISLYFDTLSLQFYHDKIDGLKDRRKFRFRTYSRDGSSNIFLEIKRKTDSIILKDRIVLKKGFLDGLLVRHDITKDYIVKGSAKVLDEYTAFDQAFGLVPQTLVAYKRKALHSKFDDRFRVTFDYDITCYDAKHGYFGQKNQITYKELVLELKFNNYLPKWFHTFIEMYQLERRAFSKYCTAIDKCKYNINYY